MKENTSIQNKYLLDFATIITGSGILLYFLGWMYWEKYFLTLLIKPSLIDIPFDKILLSTWFIILLLTLSFLYTFIQLYDNKKLNEIEVVDLAWFLLFPIYINLQYKVPDNYQWYIIGGGLIIYLLVKVLQRYNKLPQKHLSKQRSLIVILIAIYLFGIYFYRDKGEKDALAFKNHYCDNVNLTMKDGTHKYGKFIVFMNNKYFLLIESADCKKETLVINDGEVIEAKFID